MKVIDPIEYCEEHYPEACEEFKLQYDLIYIQFKKRFKELLQEEYELWAKKNMDYGSGNISMGTDLETDEDKGLSQMGIIIRANDKMQRLLNLLKNQINPQNEPIEDTLMDLAIYATMALIVRNGKWGK